MSDSLFEGKGDAGRNVPFPLQLASSASGGKTGKSTSLLEERSQGRADLCHVHLLWRTSVLWKHCSVFFPTVRLQL